MKVKKTLTGPSQGDRALLGDSEYIFFEILAIRAWNPPARQHSQFCHIRPNQILAQRTVTQQIKKLKIV